jgi:hypothetical protein
MARTVLQAQLGRPEELVIWDYRGQLVQLVEQVEPVPRGRLDRPVEPEPLVRLVRLVEPAVPALRVRLVELEEPVLRV